MADVVDVLRQLGGVATRQQLVDRGIRVADIRRLLRCGVLVSGHGGYGIAAYRDVALRLAMRARPNAVASHFTAAPRHLLRTWVDRKRARRPQVDALWMTRPPGVGRCESAPGLVVRKATLPASDIYGAEIPCTTLARTAIDLARELPFREGVVVLDHALALHAKRSELSAVLDRQANWPGARTARIALEFADGAAESVLESLARVGFASAGLPPPVLQARLWRAGQWTAERVDFCWPASWTVAEADGMEKYEAGTVEARRRIRRRDHEREHMIADLGFEVVRFTWEEVVLQPALVCARLHRAFTRGRARHSTTARVRRAL